MKKTNLGPALLLGALLAGLLAYAAAPDITGTWIGTTEVPGAGTADLTLVIKKTPTGYTGTFSDTLGQVNKDVEITAVKLEGADLTFGFVLADGTPMTARLKVEGDKMIGTWEHPESGGGAMTFERKK